jgi:hypothetical protein
MTRATIPAMSLDWVYRLHRVRKNHKLCRFVWTDEHATQLRPWCLWCLFGSEIGAIHAEELKELKQARP